MSINRPDAQLGSLEGIASIAAAVRRLAMQRNLDGISGVVEETVLDLCHAQRARCYYFDSETRVLWTPQDDELSVDESFAGAAVREGTARVTARAIDDPTYRRELDDPSGHGHERMVAQPIVATSGMVHAVVVVVRDAALPPFSEADLGLLEFWAEQIAPILHMHHVEELVREALTDDIAGRRDIYREEALEELTIAQEEFGKVAQRLPWYLRQSHLLVAAVAVFAALFFTLVHVREFASGTAIVVSAKVRDVATTRAGVVDEILVEPGEAVKQGQVVVSLDAAAEQAEVDLAQAELDRALLERLRRPSDSLDGAVARAQADYERALARLETMRIRAGSAGRVGDVRITPGRAIEPGQVVMTLTNDAARRPTVRALVPGRYRPAIEVGQPLVLDLDGFSDAVQRLTVVSVSDEVLGPTEIARVVGPQLADVVASPEPVIIVEAQLDGPTIESDGRTWTLHEGMVGRAHVVVRNKPIAFLLFPPLERFMSHV